ncbi:hypothetical protein C9J49_014335 [Halomonas sp. SL1]|nr:hypothetical protein C9J49_014335 [Halomonas sp. SL1]
MPTIAAIPIIPPAPPTAAPPAAPPAAAEVPLPPFKARLEAAAWALSARAFCSTYFRLISSSCFFWC